MLTRNFMHLLGNGSGMAVDNCPSPIKTSGASSGVNVLFGNGTNTAFSSNMWKSSKFILGTGTTTEKSTDYKLESAITENYDCSTLTKRYIQGAERDYINIFGTITNTGNAAFTFSEIGWVAYVSSADNEFLFAREVLDEPITVEPGESIAANVNLM